MFLPARETPNFKTALTSVLLVFLFSIFISQNLVIWWSFDHCVCGGGLDDVTQQRQDVESMFVYRWSSVFDAGPKLSHHWFNVLCLLEAHPSRSYGSDPPPARSRKSRRTWFRARSVSHQVSLISVGLRSMAIMVQWQVTLAGNTWLRNKQLLVFARYYLNYILLSNRRWYNIRSTLAMACGTGPALIQAIMLVSMPDISRKNLTFTRNYLKLLLSGA